MTKSNHQQRVEQFMKLAEQRVESSPTIPSKEVRLLRAKLILEEALETIKALGFNPWMDEVLEDAHDWGELTVSLEEIADGCADLSVVNTGTLSACGIHDQELLEEVDKRNLAKFEVPKCPEHGVDMMLRNNNDVGDYKCCIPGCLESGVGGYKRSDGKWIKPPDWKKPDIQGLLMQQDHDMKHSPFMKTHEEVVLDDKLKEAFEKIPDSPVRLRTESNLEVRFSYLKDFKEMCVQEAVQRITKMWEEKYSQEEQSKEVEKKEKQTEKNAQYIHGYGGTFKPEYAPRMDTVFVIRALSGPEFKPSEKARLLEQWRDGIVQEAVQRVTKSQQYNLEIDRQIHLSFDRIVQELERLVQNKTSWYNMKEFLWKELLLLVKAIT